MNEILISYSCITGRKWRENAKIITSTHDVTSPKRKDIKLSINSNAKTEMASTKKTEYVYRKTNRNKKEFKAVEITSPSIRDFFQQKSVDCNIDVSLQNNFFFDSKKSSECETFVQIISEPKKDSATADVDYTKQHSPSKPVTPHRIVCLSPEKKKTEFLETAVFHDNKRPTRNKKRLLISKVYM